MLNVPVVPLEDRCTSPEATKKAVLKGSSWETLLDKDGSDSDDGGPDAGGQAPAVDDNASSQASGLRKRRRALLRAPTDADNVEVFSNPTHPLLFKEFLHEFKSSWVMCATPEQGITLTAALSSDVRAPVLAFARNAAHKELVEKNVEKQLTNALVESRPSTAQPKVKQQSLVDLWERARALEKKEHLIDQSSSSGAEDEEDEEDEEEEDEEEAEPKKTPRKNAPKKKPKKPKTATPTKVTPTKKPKKPAAKEETDNKKGGKTKDAKEENLAKLMG